VIHNNPYRLAKRRKSEVKEKKKRKKEALRADSDEDAWHTDDSDWEGTDDDEENESRRRRHFDDGDKDSYQARLAAWRESVQQGRRVGIFLDLPVFPNFLLNLIEPIIKFGIG
jgi:hypothetical protein